MKVYPRNEISEDHVALMLDAIDAGVKLPPIVANKASHQIVDGFHRTTAMMRKFGPDVLLDVVEKEYATPRQMFLDCVKYNAQHGLPLSQDDRKSCLLRVRRLGGNEEELSVALSVTKETVWKLSPTIRTADAEKLYFGPATRQQRKCRGCGQPIESGIMCPRCVQTPTPTAKPEPVPVVISSRPCTPHSPVSVNAATVKQSEIQERLATPKEPAPDVQPEQQRPVPQIHAANPSQALEETVNPAIECEKPQTATAGVSTRTFDEESSDIAFLVASLVAILNHPGEILRDDVFALRKLQVAIDKRIGRRWVGEESYSCSPVPALSG
jgi:hypothetical protein